MKKICVKALFIIMLMLFFSCKNVSSDETNKNNKSHLERSESEIDIPNYSVDKIYNDSAKLFQSIKPVSEYNIDDVESIDDFETIKFGKFNGNDIEWIVLDRLIDRVILLSKYILTYEQFDNEIDKYVEEYTRTFELPKESSLSFVVWKESSLHYYLDSKFYDSAFNENEKQMILTNEIGEYCSIPSANECENYLKKDSLIKTKSIEKNEWEPYWLYSNKDVPSTWNYYGDTVDFSSNLDFVKENGEIVNCEDALEATEYKGVRPMIMIDLIDREKFPKYENEIDSLFNRSISRYGEPKVYDIENVKSEIASKKAVTEYNENSTVDDFDTVTFGRYELGISASSDIEWIILEKKNDKALLLSKDILDRFRYNDEYVNINWENSSLRKLLNNLFYDFAFEGISDNFIVESVLDGDETTDKVFILSEDELNKYFKSDMMRMARPTLHCAERKDIYITPHDYNEKYVRESYREKGYDQKDYYALRTKGYSPKCIKAVTEYGKIKHNGFSVAEGYIGIRPAVWVKYK